MDTAQLIVTAIGIGLIGFVLWYFFGARERTLAAVDSSGVQTVHVTVKGGYDPDTIVVQQGRPVRLEFYRDETSSCSEEIVFADFGITRKLPAHQTTAIELTPDQPGTFTFTCGMSMMRGQLIVEPRGNPETTPV